MKKILVTAIFILLAIACNGQTTIPATVTWGQYDGVVKHHIFVWEGADALTNPLGEDSSYTYLDSLGIQHYIVDPPLREFIFQTFPNGKFIQAAGINEYPDSVFMSASLTELIQKVLYQKMGITLGL